jgi:hypothetical protein
MKLLIYILSILLLVWFFGCVISYKTKNRILVDGTGIKGIEFKWWLIFLACLLMFVFLEPVGKYLLPAFLLMWFLIQFRCHWYFTIFGASEKKLTGYNRCFRDTIRIVQASDKRLIPDLYHTLMHLMILIILVLCVISIFNGI